MMTPTPPPLENGYGSMLNETFFMRFLLIVRCLHPAYDRVVTWYAGAIVIPNNEPETLIPNPKLLIFGSVIPKRFDPDPFGFYL